MKKNSCLFYFKEAVLVCTILAILVLSGNIGVVCQCTRIQMLDEKTSL